VALFGLDLRVERIDWATAQLDHTVFVGCSLGAADAELLASRGAVVLPDLPTLPFNAYRADLYSYEELTSRHPPKSSSTLDAGIAAWFAPSSTTAALAALVRAPP